MRAHNGGGGRGGGRELLQEKSTSIDMFLAVMLYFLPRCNARLPCLFLVVGVRSVVVLTERTSFV